MRSLVALAALVAALAVAPALADPYVLSVLILCLYFAFVGQAWNIMMGFAGQLSLGHSLYVGVGAYASALLFVKFGVNPWVGALAAIAVCTALGLVVGVLAFRFGIAGVYFAILTIAFAEFTRIGFDHWQWAGATGGLFLPVAYRETSDVATLRGSPAMFYYVMLAFTAGALVLCRALLASRLGYYWRAIREDEAAAEALGINAFGCKMAAVALSAGLTALGGVFLAFYYNNLFPEQIFSIHRSIEIILGPIVGGIGTLVGPILGAFLLTPLAESLSELMAWAGIDAPGVKHVFYGACLLAVVVFLPDGVWPPIARRLGLGADRPRRR
ncbi:MAG: branched-chain amino acid ABC transporter permease [Burkholderiales bacterium]|nr:branched-chain amino acid ABC transporter permease [Burkholderiales bacterium]